MSGMDPSAVPGPTVVDRRRLVFGVLPAAALLAAGCGRSNDDRSDGGRSARPPLALVYNGPQGCPACPETVAALLRGAPRPYRVEYVGGETPLTAAALADARLYVQPGGGADLKGTWRHLEGSAGAIRNWVREEAASWACASAPTWPGATRASTCCPATPTDTSTPPVPRSPTGATPWCR
ncbi:hypothetical protein ACFQHO_50245 [Actinomadura yumaensis]|uniref:hypothetical protein n=1 Tax=Actinomadura yumaensis TaxID=111807 RepID=UPI00361B6D23